MGRDSALHEQWLVFHPGQNYTQYPCPDCVNGVIPNTPSGFVTYKFNQDWDAIRDGAIIQFFIMHVPACLTGLAPIFVVVGFKRVWDNKFTRNVGLASFLFAITLTIINEFSYATYKGHGWSAITGIFRTAVNALFGVIAVVWAYSFVSIPKGSSCGMRWTYIYHVCFGNILSTVIAGIIFPKVVFTLFMNPGTSDFVRTVIAMFGANGVFFIVYAFGRVSGFVVERKQDHSGWGVVFFVTAVSALFGRTLLTGISGTTFSAGSSWSKRMGMFTSVLLVEFLRFVTRVLTPYQDKIFFVIARGMGLKAEATFDHNKRKVNPTPAVAETGPAVPPSTSPDPSLGAGKSKKSIMERGMSVKNAARPSSRMIRVDKDDFAANSWALVIALEMLSVFVCCVHVLIVEVMMVGLPFDICFTSFFITFFLQLMPQIFFTWAFCWLMSERTNFKWHAAIDNELPMFRKVLFYILGTLGTWILMTTNVVIINNVYRAFDIREGVLYIKGTNIPNSLQPSIDDVSWAPF
jgi:hypothetical protein